MLNPKSYWQSIKKYPVASAVVFSIAVHAVALAVILHQRNNGSEEQLQVMMLDLTERKLEERKPNIPEPLMAVPTPIEPVVNLVRNKSLVKPTDQLVKTSNTMTGGSAAPVQLAMLTVGMQSDISLKSSDAVLQFDDSNVSLTSQGYADEILSATHRPTAQNGIGTGRGAGVIFSPGIGMGDCK